MIAEGTVADGPNGQTAVFTGGKWIVQGSPAMSAAIPKPDQDALAQMNQDLIAKQALATRAQQFMAGAGDGAECGRHWADLRAHQAPVAWDLGSPGQLVRSMIDGVTGDNQAARLQSMDSIANQTWPLMRPAGQGRLLQTEAAAFKKAFPSTENWGQANQAAAARFQKEAADAAAQTTFVQAFVNGGKGSVADALKAYGTQPKGAAPAGPSPTAAATPTRRLSPQEAASLPAGTSFVGLDGVRRVRH
jgi:hypothetical protein